ncbi:MAG: YrhK family protein [Ornithinimicrobium sp.]
MASSSGKSHELDLHIGHDELVIRDRYEVLGILDDLLIAAFFIVGSILFFQADTATAGTWLFLLGSLMMLIRPLIALTRRVHLRRLHTDLSMTPSAAITND